MSKVAAGKVIRPRCILLPGKEQVLTYAHAFLKVTKMSVFEQTGCAVTAKAGYIKETKIKIKLQLSAGT